MFRVLQCTLPGAMLQGGFSGGVGSSRKMRHAQRQDRRKRPCVLMAAAVIVLITSKRQADLL
jgi:hypothetical protein